MPDGRRGYQWVREETLRRIREHRWPPGSLIPPETELAKEFGCARATVGRALRELAGRGVLDRRRRAGTRVPLHPIRQAMMRIPITRVEVEMRGEEYRYTLLERTRARPPVQVYSRLALPEDADMLHVRALHLADGKPYQYESRWVSVTGAPGIVDAPLDTVSANEWLVANAPYVSGEMSFSAAEATDAEAEILGTARRAPLFVIERATWGRAGPITAARLAHPPGHRLVTKL